MRVVEIGGYGNHRADQRAAEAFFGAGFEGFEDFGGYVDGVFHALARGQTDDSLALVKPIWQRGGVDVFEFAADKAFGRADCVLRVGFLRGEGFMADGDAV